MTPGTAVDKNQRINPQMLRALATICLLLSVGLNMTLLRGGSYLPTGLQGVFVGDVLFFGSAALGTYLAFREQIRLPMGITVLWIASIIYILLQFVRSGLDGNDPFATLRDLSTFVYLLALPGVTYVLTTIANRTVLLLVRVFTTGLALWLALLFAGIDLSSLGNAIWANLFSLNADTAGAVLAIGIVAWGRDLDLQGFAPAQIFIGAIGLLLQSRIASVLVIGGLVVALTATATSRRKTTQVGIGVVAVLTSILLSDVLIGQTVNRTTDQPLPGISRSVQVFLETDEAAQSRGTVEARFDTWSDVLVYTQTWPRPLVGQGPGSSAFVDSCAGACEVAGGDDALRYPHNIVLTLLLYHGAAGLLLGLGWLVVIAHSLLQRHLRPIQWVGIIVFPAAALFGVVLESPFGLIPWVFFLSWALAQPLRSADTVTRTDTSTP